MLVGLLLPLLAVLGPVLATPAPRLETKAAANHYKVVILGGGVTGIIAARALHRAGIEDFLIIEARHELGGRMKHYDIDGLTVELGANWVQGTVSGMFAYVASLFLSLKLTLLNCRGN